MERYFNNYQTTVANGGSGYIAGSGVLNVLSTSGITLNSGDTCRLSLYTGSPELAVILIVSAVNSGTQFAVTAEGADSNASDGDLVLNTLTAGGMNQIRTDISMIGTHADLPNPGSAFLVEGQRYKCTDCPYEYIYSGSAWDAFVFGFPVVEPVLANFTKVNVGLSTFDSQGGIGQQVSGSGGSQNIQVLCAPIPGSGAYYVDAAFIGSIQSSCVAGMGLSAGNSSSNAFVYLNAPWSGTTFQFQGSQFNSTSSFNSNDFNLTLFPLGPVVWLRLYDDGTTNRHWYVSPDGINWTLLATESRTNFITPAQAILAVSSFGGPVAVRWLHFSIHT